jgi:hypothetical protein
MRGLVNAKPVQSIEAISEKQERANRFSFGQTQLVRQKLAGRTFARHGVLD